MAEQIALVTGAATGIGAATTRQLAKQGVRVAVCDINTDAGIALADQTGGQFIACDVTDFESVVAAVETCIVDLGTPDFVHLNAGIMTVPANSSFLSIENVSIDQFERIVGVNLGGVFHGMKAVLPSMQAQGVGGVTVTASVAAFGSLPIDPLYSATKHALVGFVRSIATANAHSGVRINAICPGVVDTAIVPDSFRDPATIMPPDELAAEVVDLLLHGGNGEVRAKLAGKPAFEVPVIDVLSGDGAALARLENR
mgnify:CR=1 FL=1